MASVDKCAFYSLFVYGLQIFFNAFQKHNRIVYLHDIVETITPIGWLVTPYNYFLLLKDLSETHIPDGNLTIAIVTGLVDMFGSLCGGKGQRLTVSCNKSISKWNIYKANNSHYVFIFNRKQNHHLYLTKITKAKLSK